MADGGAGTRPKDRLSFASTGAGSIPHISNVALMRLARIEMNHIPIAGQGK